MNNTIGNILRKIGIFNMIAGVIVGFIQGHTHNLFDTGASWAVVILLSAVGFVSGMTFIGFSGIINLLQDIYIKIIEKDDYYSNEVRLKRKKLFTLF